MRKFLVILFVAGLVLPMQAQSFDNAWAESMKVFYNTCFDVDVEIVVYENATATRKIEGTSMRYRKCDKSLLLTTPGYDQLITEKVVLIADHEEQTLMVAPSLSKKGAVALVSIDSILSINKDLVSKFAVKKPELHTNPDGTQVFLFKTPNNEYSAVEFWFNATFDRLTRIRMFPTDQFSEGLKAGELPLIEYSFGYHSAAPEPALFSTDNYFLKKGNTCAPVKKYSSYTLLNQL
jgi:hypothetical protein